MTGRAGRAASPRSIARWSTVTRWREASRRRRPAVAQVAAVQQPQGVTAPRPAFAPDTAELTDAYATAARLSAPPAQIADLAPVFHGLFRTSAGREAVAPVVSALWSAPAAVEDPGKQETPRQAAVEVPRGGATLSLFQDQPSDARAVPRPGLTAVNSSRKFMVNGFLNPWR